jgi:antirestriction protein ArdC
MTKTDERMAEVGASVVDRLIEMISDGRDLGTWSKPWARVVAGLTPTNAATGAGYHGINLLILGFAQFDQGWPTSWYAGLRQWNELGNRVIKGSRSIYGIRPERRTWCVTCGNRGSTDCEAQGHDFSARNAWVGFSVFNHAQTTGEWEPPALPVRERKPMPEWDRFVARTGAVIHEVAQNRAYYSPGLDTITIPVPDQFHSEEERAATIAHELGHWTGHTSRTKRHDTETKNRRIEGTERGLEEFVAELAAAIVTAPFGITETTIKSHAQYLLSWLTEMRDDPIVLSRAINQAHTAAAYLADAGDITLESVGAVA